MKKIAALKTSVRESLKENFFKEWFNQNLGEKSWSQIVGIPTEGIADIDTNAKVL